MALVTADELATALGLPIPNTSPAVSATAASASEWLMQYLTADDQGDPHDGHPWDRQGALEVAVNMWQSSKSAGSQPVSADFTPAPYALGPSLIRRVSGVIAPCRDVAGMVG
jgi:hypothetical protein